MNPSIHVERDEKGFPWLFYERMEENWRFDGKIRGKLDSRTLSRLLRASTAQSRNNPSSYLGFNLVTQLVDEVSDRDSDN